MNWLLNPDSQKLFPKPQVHFARAANLIPPRDGSDGANISVVARLMSGRKLTTVVLRATDSIQKIRMAVEEELSTKDTQWTGQLKLVCNGVELVDSKLVGQLSFSDELEVSVVFLEHVTVVTASFDGTSKLFDTTTGECLQTFRGQHTITSAALSYDRAHVVISSTDCTAILFDVATGDRERVFSGHTQPVNTAVFSLDDKQVLTASDDGTVRLHSVSSGKCDQIFSIGGVTVNMASFSPDGSLILAAAGDSAAKIFNRSTGAHQSTFKGHGGIVNSAAFSSDALKVVTACSDHNARTFIVDTGQTDQILLGHTRAVNSAVFSSDACQVLTASDDGTVRIFDVMTGGVLQLIKTPEVSHSTNINSAHYALFLPGERHILVACNDSNVHLFRASTAACERTLSGHKSFVRRIALGPSF